jgi:CheY-like chemotaxis protein
MEQKTLTILHVEDDAVDSMVVDRIIKKKNITNFLYHAKNGVEALDMLRGANGKEKMPRPDLILLDLNMPKMNGIEFLKELRLDEEIKSISVYVLTTSGDEEDKTNAYSQNVAGYIIKPITVDAFENVFTTLNAYWDLNERIRLS